MIRSHSMDFSVLLNLATSGAGFLFGKPGKGGARDAWQAAAETHGLLHKPSSFWSGPKLSGSLSGNQLTVDMRNRNTASAETRFRLGMPSLNLGLRLKKKRFWNSFRPRIVTGDKAFDNLVVVEGRHKLAVQEFLTPERRTAIQSFLSSFKGAAVTDDQISLTTRGYVKKSDEMLGAIDAMTYVASVLSEETPSKAVRQSAGVPGAAIAATSTVEAVPEPVPETEQVTLTEPAAERQVSEPEPAFEPELEPEGEPEPEPLNGGASQQNAPGIEEFCATVFSPGAMSIAANQKFKESYEGARIVWTGKLESITPFTFDFDFGSCRGTKAVLTILESESLGSRNVQAVIGLPADIESLEGRLGQSVEFTGRLLKVDGLGKRVVIADALLRP